MDIFDINQIIYSAFFDNKENVVVSILRNKRQARMLIPPSF
jgi:hypothetical protein